MSNRFQILAIAFCVPFIIFVLPLISPIMDVYRSCPSGHLWQCVSHMDFSDLLNSHEPPFPFVHSFKRFPLLCTQLILFSFSVCAFCLTVGRYMGRRAAIIAFLTTQGMSVLHITHISGFIISLSFSLMAYTLLWHSVSWRRPLWFIIGTTVLSVSAYRGNMPFMLPVTISVLGCWLFRPHIHGIVASILSLVSVIFVPFYAYWPSGKDAPLSIHIVQSELHELLLHVYSHYTQGIHIPLPQRGAHVVVLGILFAGIWRVWQQRSILLREHMIMLFTGIILSVLVGLSALYMTAALPLYCIALSLAFAKPLSQQQVLPFTLFSRPKEVRCLLWILLGIAFIYF